MKEIKLRSKEKIGGKPSSIRNKKISEEKKANRWKGEMSREQETKTFGEICTEQAERELEGRIEEDDKWEDEEWLVEEIKEKMYLILSSEEEEECLSKEEEKVFEEKREDLGLTEEKEEMKEQKEEVIKEEGRKGKKFRIYAKKFFLTYPRIEKEVEGGMDALNERIEEYFKKRDKGEDIVSVIIGEEEHKDTVKHYHIYLELKKRLNVERADYFDFILEKHGNYRSVQNREQVIKYIMKGGVFKEYNSSYTVQKERPVRAIRKKIEKANKVWEVFNTEDEVLKDKVYEDGSKLETYHRRYQAYLHEKKLYEKRHIEAFDIEKIERMGGEEMKEYVKEVKPLLEFLNKNMWKGERRYKSPHILVWSKEPNRGKSTIMNVLGEVAPVYNWPSDNWYELYSNNILQFILWDEFTLTGYTQEFIKVLFTGEPMKLPIKGSQIFKKDNPLIVCGSNYSLREHVLRKYRGICRCGDKLEVRSIWNNEKEHPLCLESRGCYVPPMAETYYKALCARIVEYEVKGQLAPKQDEEKWEKWIKILKESMCKYEKIGEPVGERKKRE